MYNIKSGKDYRLVYPLDLEPSQKIQYFEVSACHLTLLDRIGLQPYRLAEESYGHDGSNDSGTHVVYEEDAQGRTGPNAVGRPRNAPMCLAMIN
jgi:hypothetical protein